MAVKLPARVRIGPFTYRVTTSEVDHLRNVKDIGKDLLGCCDSKALRITLTTEAAPDMQRETLLHELLHACTDMTGLVADLGPDKEEQVVRALSPVLLDLLRRNPQLVAYLTG